LNPRPPGYEIDGGGCVGLSHPFLKRFEVLTVAPTCAQIDARIDARNSGSQQRPHSREISSFSAAPIASGEFRATEAAQHCLALDALGSGAKDWKYNNNYVDEDDV
jgi:hypothetical protein